MRLLPVISLHSLQSAQKIIHPANLHSNVVAKVGALSSRILESTSSARGAIHRSRIVEDVDVFVGQLAEGVTATDLTLRITELLRAHGVVGKFVEF